MILERRHRPQAPGEPRERRRPRWGEFREAYPRIVAAMAVGLVAFLAIDGVLAFKALAIRRETARLRGRMTEVERRRTDAIVASNENRMQLMVALARRDAVGDKGLNLAVSADKGTMYLQREGAQLREMPVKIGPEATVGSPPDEVRLAPPLGKRVVVRVVDSSYAWKSRSGLEAERADASRRPADRGSAGTDRDPARRGSGDLLAARDGTARRAATCSRAPCAPRRPTCWPSARTWPRACRVLLLRMRDRIVRFFGHGGEWPCTSSGRCSL